MTKQEALDDLSRTFPRGSTVYTINRKTSRSGFQHKISFLALVDGSPEYPTHALSIALADIGYPVAKDGQGLMVRACGMDAGSHVVRQIASVLYGDERALRHRWL